MSEILCEQHTYKCTNDGLKEFSIPDKISVWCDSIRYEHTKFNSQQIVLVLNIYY